MKKKGTHIQWADDTNNFWHGCKKTSPGCKYCYMYRDKDRYGQDPTTVIRSEAAFHKAQKWKNPRKIFTCSWSDFFIDEADPWRPEAWEVIEQTPQHTWQILTKRPERIAAHLPGDWGPFGYANVWLGVSVENQDYTSRMIELAKLKNEDSVFKIFLSVEPLIGPVDLMATPALRAAFEKVDWVIIGGESGNETGKYRYRPSDIQWYLDLIDQCDELGIPLFLKQLGTHLHKHYGMKDRKGGDFDKFPAKLQRREFP